jgi:antitoxin (DNA-binding transcriptional repressor) of toxin-antitoxin stability system
LAALPPGDEVIITDNQQPVAKLVAEPPATGRRLGPGLGKEMIEIREDDEEHLRDFQEYMP